MSIASVNSLVLALTSEKATLEAERMVIDQRREILTLNTSELQTEYSTQLSQKTIDLTGDLEDDEEDALNLKWEQFKQDYEIATARLEAQDKRLEMQRTNIQTKLEAISTSLESAEKQLTKNVEADMKGFSS